MPRTKLNTRSVKTAALAHHLVLTSRRVLQLVEEGIFSRLPNRNFDQDACRVRYIRYLQSEGRRVTPSDSRERAAVAKAEMLELRTAKERGQLTDLADTEAVFEEVIGTYRSELSGVPASSTRDLALRTIIEGKLDEAISRCRSRFKERCEALRSGREVFVGDEEAVSG